MCGIGRVCTTIGPISATAIGRIGEALRVGDNARESDNPGPTVAFPIAEVDGDAEHFVQGLGHVA